MSFFLLVIVFQASGYISKQPQWLTSSFIRAGNQEIIKTLTGRNFTPTHTFIFSSALPGTPQLAYGVKGYKANDYIGQQYWEILRTNLTASSFSVLVQIYGATNFFILNVAYIAIDSTFPHHLNTFDNVPLNYSSGPLSNITDQVQWQTSFTEIVNYSHQANGKEYNHFQQPLTGNKIILLMTSLFINAQFRSVNSTTNITTYYPVAYHVSTNILNESYYTITVTLHTYVKITRLHFSQIIFNQDHVKSSNKYFFVYTIWETNADGGFQIVPPEFVDNFIMGLTDFSTIDGRCAIQYIWKFETFNNIFGVRLQQSIPPVGICGLSRIKSSIFYMKTWFCPSQTPYFNLTSNLCQDNCSLYNFGNNMKWVCESCYFACQTCNSPNSNDCTSCNIQVDYRELDSLNQCSCALGYYEHINQCVDCPASLGCLACLNSTTCKLCDQANGFYLNQQSQICMDVSLYIQILRGVCFATIISALIGLVVKTSLPTVQLISALHLAYLSLASTLNLQPILASIRLNLKIILGYNNRSLTNLHSSNMINQTHILKLDFQSSFFYNINIMLFIQYCLIIICLGFYLVRNRHQYFRFLFKLLQKQVFIVIMFNSLNLMFSLALVNGNNILELCIALFSAFVILLQAIHVLIKSKYYLGFKVTFKQTNNYRSFLAWFFIIRIGSSFLIAELRFFPHSTSYQIFWLQCCLFVFFLYRRPYSKLFFNLCMVIGELSLVLFLGFSQSNNQLISSQLQNSTKEIFSIIQIGLLLVICGCALLSGLYGIINFFIIQKRRKTLPQNSVIKNTEIEFNTYQKKKSLDIT